MGIAFSRICVCLFVRALTGIWLELSTPNLVHIYSSSGLACIDPVVKWSRSHNYENHHSRMVVSDHGPYSVTQYAAGLSAAVAVVGLHFDTTVSVF